MADRKADTHAKIILGSLVAKADLAAEDTAVILGVLTEAAETLPATAAASAAPATPCSLTKGRPKQFAGPSRNAA